MTMDQTQQNQTTQSVTPVNNLDHHPKVDWERVVGVLARDLEAVKKQVSEIKNDKIVEALQLPKEELEEAGVITVPHRLKAGRGWRPLLESEIDEAQSNTENATDAAKYLG